MVACDVFLDWQMMLGFIQRRQCSALVHCQVLKQPNLPTSFSLSHPLSCLAQIRYALFQEMVGYNPDLQLL